MKIKNYKCKCGHNEFFLADKGNHLGIYCSFCGEWLKWADKSESNLRMKQKSVLDEIRAEIEALGTWRDQLLIETVDIRLVLDIIDKYKEL